VNLLIDIIGLLFWFILFFTILSPTMNYWRLKEARLRLLSRMERRYNIRVITLIHRQEKIGLFGIPVYRFIDIDDSETVLRAIRTTPPEKTLALILHTPGGLVLAASQIALALKRHPGKKVVIVPHYAMSGGTLIALAADEIWMDPNAVLGPLDPQLSMEPGVHVPAPSLIKVIEVKGEKASDRTMIMADVAKKALKEVQDLIIKLLKDKMDDDKVKEVAIALTEGRWTHDYPLTAEEAKKLGLNIKMEIPEEVYELMELYPQAPTNRPGVEYIPYPIVPRPPIPREGRRV